MAQVTTVDITTKDGSIRMPLNTNDKLNLIETLAVQNIASLKSANRLYDATYDYKIENGKVIEEVVIEMAQAQAFDKTPKFVVADPVCHPVYFNNYETKQFQVTTRMDDIRAISDKQSAESIASSIADTLTQGSDHQEFTDTRNLIYTANFKDYSVIALGGSSGHSAKPASIKGVIYALRDMYNHLISDNSDLTNDVYVSSTPVEDVRIAVSDKLLNLVDVAELAQVFNLEKEELFGKLVVIPTSDLSDHSKDYMVYAYDVKALGKATRINDYSQDVYGNARCVTSYLTVERAFFHNGLFKGAKLDCSTACNNAVAQLITVA